MHPHPKLSVADRKPVDLRRLRQFVTVAETLNFRQAAELLHIAQPPLSVAIQKLELELGMTLFNRDKGSISITENGRAVLEEAKRLLYHASLFNDAVASTRSGTRGQLNVGFVGSTTYGLLQVLTSSFRKKYEDVELILREATTKDILDQIKLGKLDVGLIRTPIIQTIQISLIPLVEDHFVAAVHCNSPLAGRKYLKMTDLADAPFIMYNEATATGLHIAVMLAFQDKSILPQIAQVATQIQTVLALVESGLGVAMVPAVMQRFFSNHIVYLPIKDISRSPRIGLSLAYRSERETTLSARFREVVTTLYPESLSHQMNYSAAD